MASSINASTSGAGGVITTADNTGILQLQSASTTVATINGFGIGLGTGVPSSGIGITFPATQSASSDANTLDDYEEGTWTPTDGSGASLSFSNTSGNCIYTKIGRTVIASFRVTYPSTANTNTARIGNLPFTSADTSVNVHPACLAENTLGAGVSGIVEKNATTMLIATSSSGSVTVHTNAQVSAKDFRGVAIYQV